MNDGVATVVDVGLVLPEHWWRIPLQPHWARERSVQRLVDRQFAGIDNHPQARVDARKQLLMYAERAAEADGQLLALCLLEIDEVPVPASLVLHWVDVAADLEASPGDGSMLLGVQEQILARPDTSGEPGHSVGLAKVSAGRVLRRVYERDGQLEGAGPVPSLVADYWLERPDGAGLVQLAFATPMVMIREPMLELFDAVVSALHWVTAAERESATVASRSGDDEED